MLSKTELEYLEGKIKVNKNYEYKLLHSIRKKLSNLYQKELPLIEAKLDLIQDKSRNLGKLTPHLGNRFLKNKMHIVIV